MIFSDIDDYNDGQDELTISFIPPIQQNPSMDNVFDGEINCVIKSVLDETKEIDIYKNIF